MKQDMNRYAKIAAILTTVVFMAIVGFLAGSSIPGPPPRPGEQVSEDAQFYYTANTLVSTVNATLSVFLLATYADMYRRTPSRFTLALMIVSITLLLNALSFNPYLLWVLHFRGSGLGPFAILPGVFTLGTLITLLYLAFKY